MRQLALGCENNCFIFPHPPEDEKYIYVQGLRSRAAERRPLRLRKEEWTFSRKAEKKHKWRNW